MWNKEKTEFKVHSTIVLKMGKINKRQGLSINILLNLNSSA
jgi:hypothetical protein